MNYFLRYPKACVLFCLVGSACFSGCQNQQQVEQEVASLEEQIKNANATIVSTTAELRTLEGKAKVLANENRLHRLPAGKTSNDVKLNELSEDSDTQGLALGRVASAWDERNTRLAALQADIGKLIESNASIAEQASSLVTQVPSPLRQAETDYNTPHEKAQAQADSPVWHTAISIISRDFLPLWLALLPLLFLIWLFVRYDLRQAIVAKERVRAQEHFMKLPGSKYFAIRFLARQKLAFLALLAILVTFLSLRSLESTDLELLIAYRERLKPQLAELIMRQDTLITQTEKIQQTLASDSKNNEQQLRPEHRKSLVTQVVGPPSPTAELIQQPTRASLTQSHDAALNQVTQYAQQTEFLSLIGQDIQGDLAAAQKIDEQLKQFSDNHIAHQSRLVYTQATLVILFLCINVGLIGSWGRQRKKYERAHFHSCPACFTADCWGEPRSEATSSGDKKITGKTGKVVRCKNCGFEQPDSQSKLRHLRFPTIGYTSSGKTVWMTFFYRAILRSNLTGATFKLGKIPDTIRSNLEGIEERFMKPSATLTDFDAKKLGENQQFLMTFRDRLPPVSASGLLALYDLSGGTGASGAEGTQQQTLAYRQTEGFLYFIDASAKETDTEGINQQREHLSTFCKQIRIERKMSNGHIPVPIAVCVAKMDQNRIDAGETNPAETLEKELRDINPDNTLNNRLIQERHQIIQENLTELFPRWNIDETFRQLVGGRFMYFPMSAGNFSDENLEFTPFGIVEPVAWLMHMHGLETLDDSFINRMIKYL